TWGGEAAYREIYKGTQHGFCEGFFFKLALASGAVQASHAEVARGLMVGFLLHRVEGDKNYSEFSDPEACAKGVESVFGDELADRAGEPAAGALIPAKKD